MKYEVKFTNQFKRDLKLAKKQGKDIDRLFEVISTFVDAIQLTIVINWNIIRHMGTCFL